MQHDLQQLSPQGFQQMCAALGLAVFGAQLEVLGPGRDGGRDLYFRGDLSWSGEAPTKVWSGYTVVQIKQKQKIDARPENNASWLWGQIREELEGWADPSSNRVEVPNFLFFMTNVELTPTPVSGGHDAIRENIRLWINQLDDDKRDDEQTTGPRIAKRDRMSRVKDWVIWDGVKLSALLTVHDGVRRQFKGFLTPGDILSTMAALTDRLPSDQLEEGLRTHARTSLTGDAYVYFDEAGAPGSTGTPIQDVAIDLPLVDRNGSGHNAVVYTLDRGEMVLIPKLALDVGPRHLVVAGAPGNGKTTITKFLVQAYRAAFLTGDAGLSQGQREVIEATQTTLVGMGAHLPKNRRWPIRVDLADYAELGLDEDSTLLRWISHKISKRFDGGQVTPNALQSWMTRWPWFVVLDGLDEVTVPQIRKRLIRHVVEFVEEAEANERDVLVVLTTRPIGYVEEISPRHFERVDLAELEPERAISYGMRATRVRLRDDLDKIERIDHELRRAARDDALRHLMRTPLQVLIMTIIVEGAGQLSPDRYSLFWGYYDTVRRRELSKPGPSRTLLETHAPVILELHQRVGFELHVASELTSNATAVLPKVDLRRITREVLVDNGWSPYEVDSRWLDDIETAVTHRLVLLAPRGDGGYGFDVRSLQELMAARYLIGAQPERVHERLAAAAASPHWRNTWVFAAGGILVDGLRHEHESLTKLLQCLDDGGSERLSASFPVGLDVALDLLDDGMSRYRPIPNGAIFDLTLDALSQPSAHDVASIARILVREADRSQGAQTKVAHALREALSGTPLAQVRATSIQDQMSATFDQLQVLDRTRSLTSVLPHPHAPESPQSPAAAWADLMTTLRELADGEVDPVTADEYLRPFSALSEGLTPPEAYASVILQDVQDDPGWATAVDLALEANGPRLPDLMSTMRQMVIAPLHRRPVGEELR